MAGTKRMTADEVVGYLLEEEGADFLRESLQWVVQQLMEAEVCDLVGAEHGERSEDRLTHRNGHRHRRRDTRRRDRARAPEAAPRQLLPDLPGAAQALRASAGGGGPGGLCRRRLDAQARPAGGVARAAGLALRGLARLPGLDEQVEAFRGRPLAGRYPYVWLDAKVEKVRDGGRVQRRRPVVAHAVHETGRREVIGLDVGECETEAFRTGFLRGLVGRGLSGVQLCVSDAHQGLKQAIAKLLGVPWQRCTVHLLGDRLGHARQEQQPMLAALIRPLFNQDEREQARDRLSEAVAHLEDKLPRVATMLEEAEEDVLAFHCFPAHHRRRIRSTNPLERVNREIGRRTDVVGIFPNDRALPRLATSLVLERNDEWLVWAALPVGPRDGAAPRAAAPSRRRGGAAARSGLSNHHPYRRSLTDEKQTRLACCNLLCESARGCG
jgi:putative transposase